MKRISFIITYYNEPLRQLEECVRSVLRLPLDPKEREILLIDDGSTVPAPDFEGVMTIRQENQGLSAARNTGIELARGEYIQFLDADDFLQTDPYCQVLSMQAQYQPDMLMFRFTRRITRRCRWYGVGHYVSGIDFLCSRNMRAAVWGYLFRRSILGNLRFYTGILHEDELFTPQLLLRTKSLLVTRIPAYYYRTSADSITHQQNAGHIRQRLQDTLFVLTELNRMAQAAQGEEHNALQRRVNQLSMDYIYNVWRLIPHHQDRRHHIAGLRDAGLCPLPIRTYTLKYFLFSLLQRIILKGVENG